jgi:hypothetical protein
MASLRETITYLDKQNKSLQDSLQRERESRRASRTSKTIDLQHVQSSKLSPRPTQTSPRPTQLSTRPLPAVPQITTDTNVPATPEPQQNVAQPIQPEIQEPQPTDENQDQFTEQNLELHIEQNTAQKLLVSLEDLLQQNDQEASVETLHWLTNDVGALQLELAGAKSEVQATTKQLENKDTRYIKK